MTPRKWSIFLLVALGWFALIAQFVLMLDNRKTALAEAIIRFFSYFTILTNLVTVIYFTGHLIAGKNKFKFTHHPSVQTAITLYITIVGIVYNFVLRGLVHLQGLEIVVDELLHSIIPLFSVIYWYKWARTRNVRWNDIPYWLIYPAVYCVYILLRGRTSDFYPYPFVNVNLLGYPQVLLNCLGILLTFLFFSVLFIWIGKKSSAAR